MLTHHGILGVCLLVVHLPNLLVRGRVDLTQHAEPLAVGRREQQSATAKPWIYKTAMPSNTEENHLFSDWRCFSFAYTSGVNAGFLLPGSKVKRNRPSTLSTICCKFRSLGELPSKSHRPLQASNNNEFLEKLAGKMKPSVLTKTLTWKIFIEDIS